MNYKIRAVGTPDQKLLSSFGARKLSERGFTVFSNCNHLITTLNELSQDFFPQAARTNKKGVLGTPFLY
jgi:hypothetical protein